MKKISFLLLLPVILFACSSHNDGFIKTKTGVTFTVNGLKKRITLYGNDLVRISVVKEGKTFHDSSLAVTAEPVPVHFSVDRTDKYVMLRTDSLWVRIEKENGNITYLSPAEKIYLIEKDMPELTDTVLFGKEYYRVKQMFRLTPEEGIYGLGQFQNGLMNFRNTDLLLVQANRVAIVPVMVSTNHYGILWDNYSRTVFHDGTDGMSLASQVADQMDYYFMAGCDIDHIVAGYRMLTGKAPLFSKKAYGYWQSKERYGSFPEILGVIKQYRENNIPLDNIVLDWRYWGDNKHWSAMRFDSVTFPDPGGNIKKIHNLHVNLMVSIWPVLGTETAIYHEMDEKGLLYKPVHWSGGRVYDAYSPEARKIYWRYINNGLMRYGVDALWMDSTEPELPYANDQSALQKGMAAVGMTALGPAVKYLNTYALATTQGVYKSFRRDIPGKRAFILTRSSWAGQQRNATVTWSGDLGCSYESLKNQIPAGINFCMTGVPYWTCDIGGFFPSILGGAYPEGMDDPAFRELYVRWFQFGAFTPVFRSHGTGKPRELFRFKEKTPLFYKALVKTLRLRYTMLPYVYSLAWQVTHNDYTIMRGLVMDFPGDDQVYNIPDQYMFGPAFLVKPVTRNMYYEVGGKKIRTQKEEKMVTVYLPKNTGWYDFWTNRYHHGGRSFSQEYPIGIFPLFVKAGSVVPFGPEVQYADAVSDTLKEIRIYAGDDATFVYYEDENDNYNYEKGNYNTIKFVWNEKEKTLTIGESTGHYPGFVKKKNFKIVLITPAISPGGNAGTESRYCRYNGETMKIRF